VPNAILGLSPSEAVSYLCEPGRDVSKIPQDVLGVLSTRAWYLHSNRENKLFFKNTQNLVAKLRSTAESYNEESSLRELRTRLETIFAPTQKDVYQAISVLPAVDEIETRPDKVTLILYRPHGGGLHPDLQKLYDDQIYKNRMLFGDREKPGATPPSHRMSHALLDTNATASRATPRSKRGSALAVKDGHRGRSTASAVSSPCACSRLD
jgi:hypothetical protein